MVGYITKSAGGDYAPIPEDVHLMVCAQIVDLGTQPGSQQFPTPKRKIMIRWELPELRGEDGRPRTHSETYTWSFSDKANLRAVLESWRGKKFTEEDFAGGPPGGFHVAKLLGVPMLGQIMHDTKGDKTYANLKSTMSARMPRREQWPAVEGESFFFDLDDFDQAIFDKLPEFWQNKVKGSPEYAHATGQMLTQEPAGDGRLPIAADLDDDIPF